MSSPVVIGETIGQYRIVDVIGQGGMAAVFVGEHVMVRHRVAIKVVHPRHLDSPRMAQRFLNEARAVASIRHPGIVEFYDLGRADDGRAYIVMELLDGETVASRMRNGRIPVPRAIAFARQMASALGAAHERGIVHRDLKPANVFLVRDPDVGFGERAKILDFGIAKHTEDLEELTGAGVLVGTPAHMSPEQCRGERLDGRSDVYALGILLYHMVTGREPFDEGTTGEIVTRQICEDVPPASMVEPSVPVALSDVIARCMEKTRAARFASMEAVVEALAGVAEALELGAAPAVAAATPSSSAEPQPFEPGFAIDRPSASTLTRTIVAERTWLARSRGKLRRFALIAAGEVAVIGLAIALATSWGTRDTAGAAGAGSAAAITGAPVVCDPVPEPEPEIEIEVEAPRAAKAAPREPRPAKRDKDAAAAREKERDKERDRERAKERERTARAKPAPVKKTPPPKPKVQEDPFATVATPSVY